MKNCEFISECPFTCNSLYKNECFIRQVIKERQEAEKKCEKLQKTIEKIRKLIK